MSNFDKFCDKIAAMPIEKKYDLINEYGRTIIPDGSDAIHSGDRVIIVTKHKMFNDLADILIGSIV